MSKVFKQALNQDGNWGYKQRRVYRLDENRNRIMGEDGKPRFDVVPTTDWGSPETLEHWREAWANMVNAKFEKKGLACRIDHRSYKRRGLDIVPTVHEGVAVRQMEAKGITTGKGDFNRWIRKANDLLRNIRRKITALTDWIAAAKEELSNSQAPNLAELLNTFYTARSASAWSSKAKVGNLKYFSQAVNFLTEHRLFTLEDLETRISSHSGEVEAVKASMKVKSSRKKELEDLLRCVDLHRELKSVYDELSGIKWKSKREKFKAEHESELKQFHMVIRKLGKHRAPDGKIPVQEWRRELASLQQEYQSEYERYKPMRDDMAMLLRVRDCVDTVLRQEAVQKEQLEVVR